ncbi:hypothetical protein CO660_05170 [Rhizobium sp. L9]|nr:hypothetical protein CO660_05170 [Rhizobium sp. L9]
MIRFDTAGTRPWQRWFYAHLQVGPSPVQARAGCLLLSAIAQVLADEGQLKEVQGVPTYYFHIKHAGYVIADPDGGNFVDLDSTKIEASGALRA